MQEYVEDNPITFNDIPRVMSDILKKCDLLEQSIEILHEEIRQSNQKSLIVFRSVEQPKTIRNIQA